MPFREARFRPSVPAPVPMSDPKAFCWAFRVTKLIQSSGDAIPHYQALAARLHEMLKDAAVGLDTSSVFFSLAGPISGLTFMHLDSTLNTFRKKMLGDSKRSKAGNAILTSQHHSSLPACTFFTTPANKSASTPSVCGKTFTKYVKSSLIAVSLP